MACPTTHQDAFARSVHVPMVAAMAHFSIEQYHRHFVTGCQFDGFVHVEKAKVGHFPILVARYEAGGQWQVVGMQMLLLQAFVNVAKEGDDVAGLRP